MRRIAAYLTLLLFIAGASLALADDKPKTPFHNYTAIEVENFENTKFETKEPMPEGWLPIIREDIVQRVIELHRFRRVQDFEDKQVPQPETEKVLLLKGKIVEFSHGSQAARFVVGFGAGKGKIVALCTFVDKATGDVVWERKVDGRVIGAGQPTEGAIKGLSKELAGSIRERW